MVFVSQLLTLPFETLESTLLYSDPSALASLSQSCRSLYHFIYHAPDEHFWRLYFLQYFDDLTESSNDLASLKPGIWRTEFCKRWSIKALLGYYHDDPEGDLRDITSLFHHLLDKATSIHTSVGPSKNVEFLNSCIEEAWFLLQPGVWPLDKLRPSVAFDNGCRYLQFLLGKPNWAPAYNHDYTKCYTFIDPRRCGRMIFTFFEYPLLGSSTPYEPPNWDHLRLARELTQIFVEYGDTVLEGGYGINEMDALRNFHYDKSGFGIRGRWKVNFVYMFPDEYDRRLEWGHQWKLDPSTVSVSVSEVELFWSYTPSGIAYELHGHRTAGNDDFVASQEDALTTVSGKVMYSENGVPRWDMKLYSWSGPSRIELIGYQVGTAGSGAGVVGEWRYIDPDEPVPIVHGCFWMWRIPSTDSNKSVDTV